MRAMLLCGLALGLASAACSSSQASTEAETETPAAMEAGTSRQPLTEDASSGGPSGDTPATTAGDAEVSQESDAGPEAGRPQEAGSCVDSCPATKAGITFGCEKRFLTGVNYAWKNWAADFGGSTVWGAPGVSGNQAAIKADLMDMKAHGVDVIRWWMLQQLDSDAVTFDASGTPTGAGGTLVADIQAALDIAAEVGVHYNFTLFSFDDFAADGTYMGATLHGMKPIITDSTRRAGLMKVVKTVAQTVAASPHADRVVAWDIINEPEWAMSGSDSYGDPAFTPDSKFEAVSFDQMETFLTETATTLHQNSSALVTVGSAAIKWAHAFSHVGLDYYTFHVYDWVNQYYPYDQSLASYGVTDKPAVMGEFPLSGLSGAPLSTMLSTLYSIGYAGAMPWAVLDTCCGSWSSAGADIESFVGQHSCVTQF
jgi:hypothetical protein